VPVPPCLYLYAPSPPPAHRPRPPRRRRVRRSAFSADNILFMGQGRFLSSSAPGRSGQHRRTCTASGSMATKARALNVSGDVEDSEAAAWHARRCRTAELVPLDCVVPCHARCGSPKDTYRNTVLVVGTARRTPPHNLRSPSPSPSASVQERASGWPGTPRLTCPGRDKPWKRP
jgi:hypothetical protein